MVKKNKQETFTVSRWIGRHITGFVFGGAILLTGMGINSSYQIYTNGAFHLNNYEKLAHTVTDVLNKKKPLQALMPQNVLNPSLLNQVPLSNGKLELTVPPKGDVVKSASPTAYIPLNFTNKKTFTYEPFDSLKRAQSAHIQLKYSDMPARTGNKRPDKIDFNPVGWHNYKLPYQSNGTSGKAWLMQRGHLIGYQFCGVNDEGRNLVPETAWLNAGNYEGMNDQNQESQLYVETLLAQWLDKHQQDWLDLEVKPVYKGNNLIPEQIQMDFIGLDSSGKNKIPIIVPSSFGSRDKDGSEQIILKNYSPNAIIDYKTGQAIAK